MRKLAILLIGMLILALTIGAIGCRPPPLKVHYIDVGQGDSILLDYGEVEVLIEGRPGDLILAYEAAEKMGDKFFQQLTLGMDMIDSGVREAVKEIVGQL